MLDRQAFLNKISGFQSLFIYGWISYFDFSNSDFIWFFFYNIYTITTFMECVLIYYKCNKECSMPYYAISNKILSHQHEIFVKDSFKHPLMPKHLIWWKVFALSFYRRVYTMKKRSGLSLIYRTYRRYLMSTTCHVIWNIWLVEVKTKNKSDPYQILSELCDMYILGILYLPIICPMDNGQIRSIFTT